MRVRYGLVACALGGVLWLGPGSAQGVSEATPKCKRAILEVHQARTVVADTTRTRDARAAALHSCLSRHKGKRALCDGVKRAYQTARTESRDALAALSFVTARKKKVCR